MQLKEVADSVVSGVSFERIVVTGMFGLIFLDMILSFVLAAFYPTGDSVQLVLGMMKDIMLMTVGALVANLRHKPNKENSNEGSN